jgi:hypothetical protein
MAPPERGSGKQVVKGGEKLGRRGGITFKLPDAFQDLHKNLLRFTAIKNNTCIVNDLHTHPLHLKFHQDLRPRKLMCKFRLAAL